MEHRVLSKSVAKGRFNGFFENQGPRHQGRHGPGECRDSEKMMDGQKELSDGLFDEGRSLDCGERRQIGRYSRPTDNGVKP